MVWLQVIKNRKRGTLHQQLQQRFVCQMVQIYYVLIMLGLYAMLSESLMLSQRLKAFKL